MTRQTTRCPVCGGEMTEGTTTFAVDLEFGVVVVRDVPARVCNLCGDWSFTDPVAEALEHIVDEARGSRQEVAVTRCTNAAA